MGVACGDLDGDGRPDLAVTNFYGESTTFYRNLGGGLFADRLGRRRPGRRRAATCSASASRFLDANNDGRLDLATANGHVNDFRPDVPLSRCPRSSCSAAPSGRLADVSDRAGAPLAGPADRPRAWRPATSTTTAGSTC